MRNRWFGWFLGISVTFMAYQSWAEEIKISTYYPSPYGSYTTLDAATTLNVGPTGAPTIVMTGATGAISAGSLAASGIVSGTDLNGTRVTATGDVSAANVIASSAVSGATVTAQGAVTGASLSAGGMTIKGASTGSGDLQVANNGGKYYCYAVYA